MALTRQQEKAMFAKIKRSKQLSSKDLQINNIIMRNSNPIKSRGEPINYVTANRRLQEFFEKTSLKAFTFDPESNRGFDFKNLEDAKDYHKLFEKPKGSGNPVYTIGFTNNLEIEDTLELHSNFELATGKGFKTMFGFWTKFDGRRFIDVAVPFSGISRDEAIRLGKEHGQESITVILKNGKLEIIDIE